MNLAASCHVKNCSEMCDITDSSASAYKPFQAWKAINEKWELLCVLYVCVVLTGAQRCLYRASFLEVALYNPVMCVLCMFFALMLLMTL